MTKEETIQKSIKYRGEFLHYASILEAYLNLYIANYFVGKENPVKMAEMQTVILGDERFNFSSAVQVFKQIAETHDANWYKSYRSVRKPEPKRHAYVLNSDLVYIVEKRNVFAHRILESYDLNIFKQPKEKDTIRFIRFKDEITPVDFTDASFSLLIHMVRHISFFIMEGCKK